MATNKKPSQSFRCGNIQASVWENAGEKGTFYAATFSRSFKDASGAWRNSSSFGVHDLEALMDVVLHAKVWIAGHGQHPEN